MYYLYEDTADTTDTYTIMRGPHASGWLSSLNGITKKLQLPETASALKRDSYGELKVLYSGTEFPTTSYLKSNHPELFI